MLERKSFIQITRDGDGVAVIDYLCRRFTYHARQKWLDELVAERLFLNGLPIGDDEVLHEGDCLEYRPEPRPEPQVDTAVSVVEQSDKWAVLSKSGNLPCHPAGCFFNNTLWALIKTGRIPGVAPHDEIHFVTRLDRETSGIVLVAWDAQTARMATKALASSDAVKEYRVLVEGNFPDSLEADGWLWTAQDATVSKKRRFSSELPPPTALNVVSAATSFSCISRFDGMSELSAVLHTGRTHQIRATLCGLGYPVVGDKLYGVDETCFLRFIKGEMTHDDMIHLRMPRQALHAYRLSFKLDGREISVTAPVAWNVNR